MIAVVMSTYNGEKFLKEQIDSILSQTYKDFTLYIRDDGSTDGTLDLLEQYADSRIYIIKGENKGPSASFFDLLKEAKDAEYVFLSDQDDVWFPEKIEKMLPKITPFENIPAMVFSDFTMINEYGTQTASSYTKHAALCVSEGEVELAKVIAQPFVFGCASVINKALLDIVIEPPQNIEMHDCWISQSAAAVGKLIYMPQQTIAHRFHSSNATGREGQDSFKTRLRRVTVEYKKQADNTALRLHQIKNLMDVHKSRLLPKTKVMLDDMIKAIGKGKLKTIFAMHRNGVKRQRIINTIFFYLTVLGIKGDI